MDLLWTASKQTSWCCNAGTTSKAMPADTPVDPTLLGQVSEGSDWSDAPQEAQAPAPTSPPPAAKTGARPLVTDSPGLMNVPQDAHPQQLPKTEQADRLHAKPSGASKASNEKAKLQSAAAVLGGVRGEICSGCALSCPWPLSHFSRDIMVQGGLSASRASTLAGVEEFTTCICRA